MSDDFDDDLYNVYNGGDKVDTIGDEDLYDEQPDTKEEKPETDESETKNFSIKNEEKSTRDKYNRKWNYPPYQQYNMYQRIQEQMPVNSYQMHQMMQRQIRQPSYPSQPYRNKESYSDTVDEKAPVASAANQDEGKMFIGGLNWETTDESLHRYFSQFGEVVECVVMRDPTTHRSRGFGFLTMKENSAIDKIVSQEHHLDGKRIDPKRAVPRDEQDKTEKIFVGGISPDVNEEEFREFFSQFGNVIDATLMTERDTGRPRGFGFITFESSDGVEQALSKGILTIKDKTVEVKRAMPKPKQGRIPPAGGMINSITGNPPSGGVFNPNFRQPHSNNYIPNSRYSTPNYGPMNRSGFSNYNMYNNMYGGFNNYNVAAAYYGNRGGYGGMGYNGGGSNPRQHNYGSESSSGYYYGNRVEGEDRKQDREDRRYPKERGSNYSNSYNNSNGGGAVHASQSRSSQHYRPY